MDVIEDDCYLDEVKHNRLVVSLIIKQHHEMMCIHWISVIEILFWFYSEQSNRHGPWKTTNTKLLQKHDKLSFVRKDTSNHKPIATPRISRITVYTFLMFLFSCSDAREEPTLPWMAGTGWQLSRYKVNSDSYGCAWILGVRDGCSG